MIFVLRKTKAASGCAKEIDNKGPLVRYVFYKVIDTITKMSEFYENHPLEKVLPKVPDVLLFQYLQLF